MKSLLARLRLRHHPVLALIFVTGAAVLAIEVTATRLLAPSFGTTVFTVSSVISVVLGALSLGYYVGGRAADRYPAPKIFYSLIFGAGVAVFMILPLLNLLLPTVNQDFDLLTGPLVAAIALFFVPSMLLGALSPLAVVLYQSQAPHRGTGRAAGSVSFWSTFGSIFGSLSTAFIFIPRIGLGLLVLGVGGLLVVIGTIGLIVTGVRGGMVARAWIIVPILLSLSPGNSYPVPGQLLYQKDGRYGLIRIFQGNTVEDRMVRSLKIDDSSSAARFLQGNDLAYHYTRYAELLWMLRPGSRHALVIGGGAYSVPQALVDHLPKATVDVAEIEPDLYGLSKKYFGLKDNPRLVNHVEDGRRFLFGKTGQYDVIFGDAYYSVSSIPQHLTTQEFFQLTRDSLAPDGIYMMNVIGRLAPDQPSFTLSEIKTFQTVFPHSMVVAVNDPNAPGIQNLMFVGFKGAMPDLAHVKTTNTSYRALIARTLAQTVDLSYFNFAPHKIFTDDFSPVDYYIATTVRLNS